MTNRLEHLDLPTQTREAEVRKASLDRMQRTVEVIVSTGARVKRYGWLDDYDEELVVDEKSVDLRRLNSIGVVLDNHRAYGSVLSTLGAIVRGSAKVENGQVLATLRFADTDAGNQVMRLIEDDILRSVSVGYDAEYERTRAKDRDDGVDRDLFRATRWEPYEVSIVQMPADAGATVRADEAPRKRYAVRSREEKDMTTANAPATAEQKPEPAVDLAAERKRFAERLTRFEERASGLGIDAAKVRELVTEFDDDAKVGAEMLRMVEERQAGDTIRGQVRIDMGRTHEDKQGDLLRGAILSRAMQGVDPKRIALHNERAKVEGLEQIERITDVDMVRTGRRHLLQLAEQFLESRNVSTRGMSPNDIAGNALAYRSGGGSLATTADFSSILGNAANKMLWAGYAEVTSQWRELIGVRMDKPDFKQFSIYRRSAAPDLEYVNEHGEVKRASYNVPTALTGQVRTAGIQVGFTRQMLVNDDLDAFAQQSLGLGDSAMRFEDDFVITTLLYGNPTLGDGTALFAAGRGNLSTDVGAPDLAAVIEVARLFAKMTETIKKAGNNAGTTTRKISQDVGGFIGAFTEAVAINQILRPENYTPTSASGALPDFLRGLNAYRESRLLVEANSPDVWFGFSRNRKAIAYGYLAGETQPRLTQFQAANTDGVIFQLLHDWYGAVADPYALVRVPKS